MLDSNILRDQMTVRRLRLAAGLIMFSYLTLHFIMHALGNVSLEAMQWDTRIRDFVWHSTPGTIALYGAFAIHFTLALYALYAHRSFFAMGVGELARLLLGFSILPLLFHHFTAGRFVYSGFDVTRRYDVVLLSFFLRSVLGVAATTAPGLAADGRAHVRDPSVNGPSWNLEVQLYSTYVVFLALVFVARPVRWLVDRRWGLINIV